MNTLHKVFLLVSTVFMVNALRLDRLRATDKILLSKFRADGVRPTPLYNSPTVVVPLLWFEQHINFRQIGTANLLTSISIFLQPLLTYFNYGKITCCINSSLTTIFMVVTFCLKFLVVVEWHKHMQNTLARSNSQLDHISCSYLKAMNIVTWIMPVVSLISWVSYLKEHSIYLLQPSCNWTMHEEFSQEFSKKNNFVGFLLWFNNSLPVVFYLAVLVAILIMTLKLMKMYIQANRNRGIFGYCQRHREKQMKAHFVFNVFVFLICWGPSIFINLITLYNSLSPAPFCLPVILFLLQAMLAPSQGIIDFILFYTNMNRCCVLLAPEADPNIMTPLLHSNNQ